MELREYVVGSDGEDFILVFTDAEDVPINITGALSVRVQGQSQELTGTDLDIAGTIYDGPNGKAKFAGFGNAVTVATLGALPFVTYTLRGRVLDAANKTKFTPEFQVRWVHQPLP